jgi:hypothetical protein
MYIGEAEPELYGRRSRSDIGDKGADLVSEATSGADQVLCILRGLRPLKR